MTRSDAAWSSAVIAGPNTGGAAPGQDAAPSPGDAAAWGLTYAAATDEAHLATGDRLSDVVDRAVSRLGLRAELFLVDLAQRTLCTITAGRGRVLPVEGSLPGRVFQLGEIAAGEDGGDRVLWVPMLDGTERVGVLRLTLDRTDPVDHRADDTFRSRCLSLAGLMGHIVMTKVACSDHLRRLRAGGTLSVASELLWELAPPRTFATGDVVISALLEPFDRVAGDAYDYAVDDGTVDLVVFDGVGHDLDAGMTTALALTANRHARREGVRDLAERAARIDAILDARGTRRAGRFVTAVLIRLERATGRLHYLLAGHPAPLLVRGGHVVKELARPVQLPLGLIPREGRASASSEQLEPGDRLLVYTDGITEARDAEGEFFGLPRLRDLAERVEQDHVSAPETLRRLDRSVLDHQDDVLQDDATLVILTWSSSSGAALFPTDAAGGE